ncbi:YciI family protein [Hyphomonas sp. WL0036]|uniref:YciI family protein n=1 Tax=Hyphomonas sediminis TaxID=2866160 RepID=UPI001C7F2ABE|nr:YciI family protein [Hyphomonas sediminis]MBY9066161.1 YciI family protein [Hyphomonas sediminis]
MPLYCLHCLDNETDGAERRAAARPAHLEWVVSLGDTCRMAGPLLNEDGKMIGSVFLMEAESADAARALNAADPYVKGGVFGRVSILETRWAFGGGKPE